MYCQEWHGFVLGISNNVPDGLVKDMIGVNILSLASRLIIFLTYVFTG